MNKRIKKLWIKALRSGKYRQVRCALRDNLPGSDTKTGFCCLGVLTDVYRKVERKGQWRNNQFKLKAEPNFEGGVLPKTVAKWAGLKRTQDPKLGLKRASVLNDAGASFEAIADRIEKYL